MSASRLGAQVNRDTSGERGEVRAGVPSSCAHERVGGARRGVALAARLFLPFLRAMATAVARTVGEGEGDAAGTAVVTGGAGVSSEWQVVVVWLMEPHLWRRGCRRFLEIGPGTARVGTLHAINQSNSQREKLLIDARRAVSGSTANRSSKGRSFLVCSVLAQSSQRLLLCDRGAREPRHPQAT